MTGPLVSIITPTYNHEQFLAECIESALAQTYANWEMIIVNDGSTDGTMRIAERYQQADQRIQVIDEPHRGIWRLPDTYNAALKRARGDLIAILEGDDLWFPHRLELQLPLFAERIVLVFGPWKALTEDGRLLEMRRSSRAEIQTMLNRPIGTALQVLLARNPIVPCTVLIDRDALERVGGFQHVPGFPAVDYPTWLKLALEGEFRYNELPAGCWRVHRGQTTHEHVVQLAEGTRTYTLSFFRQLGPELRGLSRWNEAALARALGYRVALAHAQAGRRRLMEGRRRTAAKHFVSALAHGDLTTRLKASVGLFCFATGVDIERLARLAGRPYWW